MLTRHTPMGLMLALTGLAAWAASFMGYYPLRGRLFLFVVPGVYLLVSGLIEALDQKKLKYLNGLIAFCLVLAVFLPSTKVFFEPVAFSEIRSVMQFVAADYTPEEDKIAVSEWSLPAYEYYKRRFGVEDLPVIGLISVENDPQTFLQSICTSPHPGKTWLLFSHRMIETMQLLDPLRALTTQITQSESVGAGVYFFDFSDPHVCQGASSP